MEGKESSKLQEIIATQNKGAGRNTIRTPFFELLVKIYNCRRKRYSQEQGLLEGTKKKKNCRAQQQEQTQLMPQKLTIIELCFK